MDFDREINRYNTKCLKYDDSIEHSLPKDAFPMWVADMDFMSCEEISAELHKAVDYGVYGYSVTDIDYFNAIKNWYEKHYDVELKREWLVTTPGVVYALSTAIKAFTAENDPVLICKPVYHPFREKVIVNNRRVVSSDLVYKNNRYEIDFKDFEDKIVKNNIKLFLLCSPHNPISKVWTKTELDRIVEICKKYDIYVVSDEIHSEFVWKGTHTCMLRYQDFQDNIVLCTAPSKTFNLAGLQASNIFIPNKELKQKFQKEMERTGYWLLNRMGLIACQAAYTKGEKWLGELKTYLLENIKFVDAFLKERLPKVKLVDPEGTYLLWLDFNELNLPDKEIENLLINKAKLLFSAGYSFGENGKGFQRVNVALPRAKLKYVLERLEETFKEY